MHQKKPQKPLQYSCASKVFLLGEYAVLAGLPALVAALPPRFKMQLRETPGQIESSKTGSPLQRLQAWIAGEGIEPLGFDFLDPYGACGGFGASTAEFAMGYLAYSRFLEGQFKTNWQSVWAFYRKLMEGEKILPSGADLVAQWQGGVAFFDPSDAYCLDIGPLFNASAFLIFSATSQSGRKVATHEHLKNLEDFRKNPLILSRMEEVLISGIAALRENHIPEFAQAINAYANLLSDLGFEIQASYEDRKAMQSLEAVIGVKGIGAMQADGLIVLLRSAALSEPVIQLAQSRGLTLVSAGIPVEMGIACQM